VDDGDEDLLPYWVLVRMLVCSSTAASTAKPLATRPGVVYERLETGTDRLRDKEIGRRGEKCLEM
jgi:hypothetical protein